MIVCAWHTDQQNLPAHPIPNHNLPHRYPMAISQNNESGTCDRCLQKVNVCEGIG